MSLLKNINKSIEKTIVQFTKEISEKYGMPHEELIEMWENASKMKTKSVKSPNKKVSPWLQFCKDERVRLKTEQPQLKFGEISKIIGEKWSAMTTEEKQKYSSSVSADDGPVTTTSNTSTTVQPTEATTSSRKPKKTKNNDTNANTVSNTPSTNEKWTRENLEKMSISELKELCESIKLSKTGKKNMLIDRLMNCSEENGFGPPSLLGENQEGMSDDEAPCSFNYDSSSD